MGIVPKPSQPSDLSLSFEANKALLRKIELLGNLGTWEIDLQTGNHTWSNQLFRIFGLESGSFLPSFDAALRLIHPEDRDAVNATYHKSLETGVAWMIETRIIWQSGEVRNIVIDGTVDLSSEGKPIRVVWIFRDRTDEKRMEDKLRRSNLQIDNILNTTQDLIFLTDENGYFLKVSKSCDKILGYPCLELIGKSFKDLVHPDDYEATLASRDKLMEGLPSSDFQNRYFKKDGSIVYLNWSATLDVSSNTVFAVARDITQLIQAQESLNEDRKKLSIVLDSSPETIWALDPNYNLITCNHQFNKSLQNLGNWDVKPGDNLVFNTPLPEDFVQEWKDWYDRALLGESFTVIKKVDWSSRDTYLETHFKPIYEGEKLTAVGCYSLDITSQKEEELRIKELVRRLNLSHKIGKMGYWEIDRQTEDIYWSDEVFNIWQLNKSEFRPTFQSFLQTVHPDDQDEVLAIYNSTVQDYTPVDAVHRIILPSGEVKYVHEKGGLETNPDTGELRFSGTVQDITKEKLIAQELLSRNEFIETTLQNLPLGIAVNIISTGKATYINPAFAKIYGWYGESPTDVDSFFTTVFQDKEYREMMTKRMLDDINSGDASRMEWKNMEITTQRGEHRIVTAKNIPLFEQNLMISTAIDVTDRYWAEHALRVSNERFHLATQAVSDAIWDWDMENDYVFWAKGYKRLFGYVEEQVPVNFWKSRIHPDDFPSILESIAEAKNNKSADRWSGEYRFIRFDGSYAFVKENLVILRDEEGVPHRMVGALQDISEEKEKENHLKLLESVVTNTRDGVLITEAEPGEVGYKIIYANDQFFQMTGYTSDDILGKSPAMFQGPLTDRSALKQLKQDLLDKKPSTVELINYRKDGSTYWVNFSLTPVADQKGNYTHWMAVQRDVSQQKKNQAALAQKTCLIATTAEIIQSLLETNDWEESISDILIRIGAVIDADRVYLFKNFVDPDNGKLASQQLQEWTNGKGIVKYDGSNLLTIYLEDHPLLLDAARARHTLAAKTRDMVGRTRYLLDIRNSKSVLQIPFYVMGEFYGFIGFDDCRSERDWTEDETGFLTSISTNLAFAIERKINLDKVQEALESRKVLLESIGDSFYALDKDCNVTYWNNVVEKLTGVKREDILGRNVWDFVEIQNEKFKIAYEKALRDNEAQYFESFDPWVKAWLEVTIYPAHGGLSAIVKDITARKNAETQLAESNQRFSILSDAINDAIWDWNIDTNEHYWGEGFQKLFGIDIEVEGSSPDFWHKRVHPDDLPFVEDSLKRLLSINGGSYFESEYRFQRQDGSYAYVIDKSSVIRNDQGVPLRVVGVMMDISQRKTYEESLKKLNEELAHSNRELEISNKELEQFAYVASHDLQEPLRMISSFLGLIERKYQDNLDDKGRQYIHFAVDGARRMRDIILDLLDFSRVGSYTEPKKIVSGNDMIQEILLLTKKAIQETDALIRVEPLPDLFCHSSSIIQLFQNLVSNALKYQAPGNRPEITISCKELDEDWLFSVQDNGIGIDPQFKDKIFVIFQRLHQKEQFSGSGIGLAICKKIVEFHGGKIWVESTLGEGCTFFFTLKK